MGWAAVAAMLVMLARGRAVPPALHGRVLIPPPPPPPPPPPAPSLAHPYACGCYYTYILYTYILYLHDE